LQHISFSIQHALIALMFVLQAQAAETFTLLALSLCPAAACGPVHACTATPSVTSQLTLRPVNTVTLCVGSMPLASVLPGDCCYVDAMHS
jgi:hypothetical protein